MYGPNLKQLPKTTYNYLFCGHYPLISWATLVPEEVTEQQFKELPCGCPGVLNVLSEIYRSEKFHPHDFDCDNFTSNTPRPYAYKSSQNY